MNLADFSYIVTDIVSFFTIYFFFFLSFELNETLFYGVLFQDFGCPDSLYSSHQPNLVDRNMKHDFL